MEWRVDIPVLAAFCIYCFLTVGFCQDPTDIDHGCYFDHNVRAMTDLITCTDAPDVCQESCSQDRYCESDTSMTLDFCRTLCRNRNLKYYGLEAGTQCFCGGALSNPFTYGRAESTGPDFNCSYPCKGDASQTCGGEYKLHIYEFNEPVMMSTCFHPGFVDNSFISDGFTFRPGDKVNYICLPGHTVVGNAELVCQSVTVWTPNELPSCNYTEKVNMPATTVESTTTVETTTAEPLTGIMAYLPYIIGGAVAAAVLFVFLCLLCLCCRRRRKRSGGSGKDIRLKPDAAPVTFINAGFHVDDAESADAVPEVLATEETLYSPGTENRRYEKRTSTFTENPLYENGAAMQASGSGTAESDRASTPPSPLYAKGEVANEGTSGQKAEANLYTNSPTSPAPSTAEEPTFYPTTGIRRARKNATGTKDLVGWSRPSSLYQRTVLDDDDEEEEEEEEVESNEDNTTVRPQDLAAAIYAQVDKSKRSESQENLTSDDPLENSFFGDPTKSSATPL